MTVKDSLKRRGLYSVVLCLLALCANSLWSQQAAVAASPSLKQVVALEGAVGVVWEPGTSTPLVVQKGGYIRPLFGKPLAAGEPILDVQAEVSDGGEQGLLAAAFSLDGSRLYVNLTNKEGNTEIREYAWKGGRPDPAQMRLLLAIDQPYANHNGGHLAVDKQGYLWIATGDGGSAGDPGNRSQDRNSLLGKILRIDPLHPSSDLPYGIPSTNPFKPSAGRPEIWALGLRNPWKFDLDQKGGRIYIGDVGQGEIEEINSIPLTQAGANFGWNIREGKRAYKGGTKPKGMIDPIAQYTHASGCSVTGGVVYRGKAAPSLAGRFLYGDFCKGWISSVGRTAIGAWEVRSTGLKQDNLSSFNTAPDGELWVTSTIGTVSVLSA